MHSVALVVYQCLRLCLLSVRATIARCSVTWRILPQGFENRRHLLRLWLTSTVNTHAIDPERE